MRSVVPVATILLIAACGAPHATQQPSPLAATPSAEAMRRDVGYLASDALEGRRIGTPGNDSAAALIVRRFAALGLSSVGTQPFIAHSAGDAHAGRPSDFAAQNVIGIIPGTDPRLRGQYVVLGAHFDHLGRSSEGALDPDAVNAIRNGADDNASGTAAILELARVLQRSPTRRSIAVVAFSGEEQGLLGSQWFVDHAPFALDSVQAMLNFDMVGRMQNDQLLIFGAETATELAAIIDSANAVHPLNVTATGDGNGSSDQVSFYLRNLPVLHFFTNVHDDYHKATDDAERVNYAGMASVVGLAERVTRLIADRPARLTFVRAVAKAPTASKREGASNAYLGTIPDMGASGVKGLRLSGVRAGSPADSAGLRAGDVVIEIGGVAVTDLYSYTDALYSHKPGETVTIVALRGTERISTKATLGTRGG